MSDVLAQLEAEMAEQRRATVKRFAQAIAAVKAADARLAAVTGSCWDASLVNGYKAAEAEFHDAREQVEAWEAFTPNHGDW
jgi:hypothetical protein